jgi:hypothetical protein
MKPDKYVELLKKIGRKGFNVKLPKRLPQFAFPASFEGSFGDGGSRVQVGAKDATLEMNPEYMRLGFDATLRYLTGAEAAADSAAEAKAEAAEAAAKSAAAARADTAAAAPTR